MKRFLLALALLLVPAAASAQCNGVFPNNTVCGNVTGSNNTPRPTNPSAFLGAAAGTNGQIQYNNSGALGGFGPITGDIALTVPGGVTTIQPNSVITSKINNAAVTAAKLAGNALPTYASRADALAVDLSGFTAIQTLGFAAPGDGGGAIFAKVAAQPFCGPFSDTASFQDSAGNWWDIAEPKEYNIRQFGAKQDSIFGVSGTDDTAAILSALRCAGLQTGAGVDVGGGAGKIVRIPSGWSLVTSTITVPNQVPVIGICPVCNGFDMATGFSTTSHFFILGDQYTQTDIAAAQSRGSAGNLTLNTSSQWYRSGTIYTLYSLVPAIYSASNNSGVNFTFTGTDRFGNAQNETIAGPTAGSFASSAKFWRTITQVATSAATVGNVSVGFPQIATFGTRLQDLQLFSSNLNATNFTTSINNSNTLVTGKSGNAMVYTNSVQHTGGLERVKIFAGDRMATLFEVGVGGASYFTFKDVETFNSGNCGGCAVNNPQMYFNYAGLATPITDAVIGGPGASGGTSTGLFIEGGYAEVRVRHAEGVHTAIDINITSVNNGSFTASNLIGSASITDLILIENTAASNITYVQGIFSNGATHTVNNKGVNTTGNIITWTQF